MRRAFPLLLLLPLAFTAALACPAVADEGVPTLEHVIVVVMENHDVAQALAQPYTASLAAASARCANSHAVTHPSQPNYLALWGASTMDVVDDACPPAGVPYTSENLGHACEAAGLSWKAYSESLPAPGSTACWSDDGESYSRKHAPWTNWNNIDHAREVPFEQFALDTAAHALPRLAFVIPTNCHNTHDCDAVTGDAWLAATMPGLLQAVGPNGLVILTWDEDDYAGDNSILTVFAGPLVKPGFVSPRAIDHYTVVRTITAGLGLAPFANAALDSALTDVWGTWPGGVTPATHTHVTLDAPAPSPTHGIVRATLHLVRASTIDAGVYDAGGRLVRALHSGLRTGDVAVVWDGRDANGRDAGSGVFFLRVRADGADVARRFVRVR